MTDELTAPWSGPILSDYFQRRQRRVRITHEALLDGFPRLPDGVRLVAGKYRRDHGDWELTLEHDAWPVVEEGERPPLAQWFLHPARTEIVP